MSTELGRRVAPLPAVTSIAARAGAATAMRRLARLACALTVVVSPMRASVVLVARPMPPLYGGYTDVTVSWGEIGAALTVALWLLSLALSPRRVTFGPGVVRWPLLGLTALAVASAAWSIDPTFTLFNAAELALLAGFGLFVLNEIDLAWLARPIAAMLAVEAAVGIFQVARQHSLGLGALGELPLAPATSGVSVVATSAAARLLRAYGLADHPNILGGILAVGLLLLLGGITSTGRGVAPGRGVAAGRASWHGLLRSARWPAVLALGVAVLGVTALALTFSRSAWLGFALGLVLGTAALAIRRDRRTLAWLGAGAVGIAIAVVVLAPLARFVAARADVLNPPSTTEEMAIGERQELIAATLRVIDGRPVTGTGFAALPQAVERVDPTLGFDAQPGPIVLLDAAAELGPFGAALAAILLAGPLVAAARRRSAWSPGLIAACAALLAIDVVGVFDYYPWTYPAGRIWLCLVLAILAREYLAAVDGDVRP